jgi:uncharacterized protein YndB with AHSA1/START domain
MNTATQPTTDLVISRTFKAQRALVFACWTEQEHKEHWQGAPQGFTVTFAEAEIRPGGTFKLCMRSPEGVDHWLQGTYLRVVKPELLEFTHCWLKDDGSPGHETLVTITFADRNGSTELTLRQSGFASNDSRDGHSIGWSSTLDQLTTYLNTIS